MSNPTHPHLRSSLRSSLHSLVSTRLLMVLAVLVALGSGQALHAATPPSWQATGAHIGTRFQQLCAVNAEWHLHPEGRTLAANQALLADTDELVQAHLLTVHALLTAAKTPHLSPEQQAKRAYLLQTLHTYATAGAFPQNLHYNRRTPIFVDDAGTHCAVGYLLHVDGRDDLVSAVRKAYNLIYIKQIARTELATPFAAWQQASGFSVDELALIQPGYPPSEAWDSLPMPANSKVHALLPDWNGSGVYVGGEFSIPTSNGTAYNIARWNGSAFEALAGGVSGPVYALSEHNGKLAVGGSFSQVDGKPTANVALYNPISSSLQWQNLPDASGPSGVVFALASFDGNLFAGGQFSVGSATNGTGNNVGRLLPDNTWSGYAFNGPVYAFFVEQRMFLPYLVAGGGFSKIGTTDAKNLAQLRPVGPTYSWHEFLGGINTVVRDIDVLGFRTVIGGDLFDDANRPIMGFAIHADTGWLNLSDLLTAGAVNTMSEVRALSIPNDSTIIVAGRFQFLPLLGIYGANIARFQFNANLQLQDGRGMAAEMDAPVHTLAQWGNDLYIGGRFNEINYKGAYGFARTTSNPSSVQDPAADPKAASRWLAGFGPNPSASGLLKLHFDAADAPASLSLTLVNTLGQTVFSASNLSTAETQTLDLSALPAGVYIYTLSAADGRTLSGRWLRQ